MNIQGVVFDFGGVISCVQEPTYFATVKALTGWDRETVLAGWARHRRLLDSDAIGPEELYRRMAADLGQTLSEEALQVIVKADYDSWSSLNPETLAWAKELKAAGYRIGILTNMPSTFIPWFERCAGEFRRLADRELISGLERLAKPQPEIYALMEQRMELPPGQLFFFDDTLRNVEAAQARGWQAAQFVSVPQAREAFAQLTGVSC